MNRTGVWLSLLLIVAFAGCSGDEAGDDAATDPGREGAIPAVLPDALAPPPELPELDLIDHEGKPVGVEDLRGKPTLMTFIYTSCPMPEMCPATSMRFAEVQRALSAEERARVRLLSVTFDPEFDTPEVLRRYGELNGADFSVWRFWTGAPESIQKLASAYGFWYQKSGETFDHSMVTAIMMPDGSLHRVLTGSAWDAKEAAATLRRLIQN